MNGIILIGAGGHAQSLLGLLNEIRAYVDPKENPLLSAQGIAHWTEEKLEKELVSRPKLAMGFVGLNTAALQHRLSLFDHYQSKGAHFPKLIHPRAIIDEQVVIGSGTQILAGAVINRGARIGNAAVINSGAVIEHDANIEDGCHIAPGAIILGGAAVGKCSFIGSGAVVVQQAQVQPNQWVRALSIHNN
jgi:sugar O-acyltransferase (sialic acid O-acetyltransferase NeuD family)